ncbi:MAG: UDP-N-acetylmuramoyl-L-alanyl-D-glutamate--2,6-diaminopimelate ligase, partial [Oxalobacter sp.]|nr:UDP-N-acetylmuramoyl-L-alanyl-D-glutamate--2,6-diaminopimelate ligase [Oxalobacter sp.]
MNTTVEQTVGWLRENCPDGEIFSDSRNISPDGKGIFFAYEGDSADGRDYIASAVVNGAKAVVYESKGFVWDPKWQVPHLSVSGLKENACPIA